MNASHCVSGEATNKSHCRTEPQAQCPRCWDLPCGKVPCPGALVAQSAGHTETSSECQSTVVLLSVICKSCSFSCARGEYGGLWEQWHFKCLHAEATRPWTFLQAAGLDRAAPACCPLLAGPCLLPPSTAWPSSYASAHVWVAGGG